MPNRQIRKAIESSELIENQITKSNQNIEQTNALNKLVRDSLVNLNVALKKQQKDLVTLQNKMKSLFESFKTESFKIENNSKTRIIELSENMALVIIRLESVPIPESVKLQYHIYSQPPNSYWVEKNIVFFSWGDRVSKLNKEFSYVSYAADSSADPPLGEITEKNKKIYAGDELIFEMSDN